MVIVLLLCCEIFYVRMELDWSRLVASYEFKFINDVDYELSCFGIGFRSVRPLATFILNAFQ